MKAVKTLSPENLQTSNNSLAKGHENDELKKNARKFINLQKLRKTTQGEI